MAKKAGKSAQPRPVKRRRRKATARVRRLNTHPLFNASRDLKAAAQKVLGKLDGSPDETKNLKQFISDIGDIQLAIKEACSTMGGGNPMFNDFKVKSRA